jgi:23S rRNA (cytosine1962-C5)-methyltransferase
MPALVLAAKRDRSALRRHPWIFSGAIQEVRDDPQAGDAVDVLSRAGDWLARATYSPASAIRARIWTFDPDEPLDADFCRRRVQAAVQVRAGIYGDEFPSAWRILNGEGDGLPGVVADCYGDIIVAQFLTCGADQRRDELVTALRETVPCTCVFERSDTDARRREGLEPSTGLLWGTLPDGPIEIREDNVVFQLDVQQGHKTGFYLDQRENRRLVGSRCAGRDVLNCFCYTGGFTLHALANGAKSTLSIDTSQEALDLAAANAQRNGFEPERADFMRADVFRALRTFRDSRRDFDVIMLDPPKFADTRNQLQKASRGYKDINLLGLKLLRPGGELFTFSCSGAMTPELFQKIVADAALDAGREAIVLHELRQAPDHVVSTAFPEGRYLNGLHLLVR